MIRQLYTLIVVCGLFVSTAHAQLFSSYTFAESSGTYSPISGGTVLASGTGLDEGRYPVTLPFSFNINGIWYTSAYVAINGYLTFSTDAGSGLYWPIASSTAGFSAAAGFAANLASLSSATELRYETVGTTPNRTFIVQWKQFGYPSSTTLTTNFQIRLRETTSVMQVVFGSVSFTSGTISVQSGLRGTNAGAFYHRAGSWASSSNASTNTASLTATPSSLPSSGLTYTFTPPFCNAPGTPSLFVFTPGFTDVSCTFTPPSPSPAKYIIVRSPGVATLTASPVNGSQYNVNDVIGNGIVVYKGSTPSFSNSGLTENTLYRYTVFPYNEVCINPYVYNIVTVLSDTIRTYGPNRYVWQPASGVANFQTPSNWYPLRKALHPNDTLVFDNGGTVVANNMPAHSVKVVEITNGTKLTLRSTSVSSPASLKCDSIFVLDTNCVLTLDSNPVKINYGTSNPSKIINLKGVLAMSGKSVYDAAYTNTTFFTPVSLTDSAKIFASNGIVTLKDSLNMTDSAKVYGSAGQLYANGPVNISGNSLFDLTGVKGIFTSVINVSDNGNLREVTTNAATDISYPGTCTYNHKRNGGYVPKGAYSSTSTINITGIGNTQPIFQSSILGNLTWNCPGQSANLAMTNSQISNVNGNMEIVNTGGFNLRMSPSPTVGGASVTEIAGNFKQYAGTTFQLWNNGGLRTKGNLLLDGGTLDLNNSTTSANTLQVFGNMSQKTGHLITRTSAGSSITFAGATLQNIDIGGTVASVSIAYTLNNIAGANLTGILQVKNTSNTILAGTWLGSGGFVYDTLSTLIINTTGNHTLTDVEWPASNEPGNVTLNITDPYPDNRLKLHGNRSVYKKLTVTKGVFDIGNFDLILKSGTASDLSIISPPDSLRMIATSGTGYLYRKIPVFTTQTTYLFPIGDLHAVPECAPVTLYLKNNTGIRYIGVRTIDGRHPNNNATSNTISRYWSFKDTSTAAYAYRADFDMPYAGDVPGSIKMLSQWNGATWKPTPATVAGNSIGKTIKYATIDTLYSTTQPLANSDFSVLPLTGSTYSWSGTVDNDYQNPANWQPNRNAPAPADILQFVSGGYDTVINIPSQTVRRLIFSNNTTTHLQAANSTGPYFVSFVIAGDSNSSTREMTVDSGSAVYLDGTVKPFAIVAVNDSSTAAINGRLELVGYRNQQFSMSCNGCTCIVAPSGILSAGGSGPADFYGKDSNTFYIQGKYEYKFSTIQGSIPNARWASTSSIHITGITTNIDGPTTLGTPYNFKVRKIIFDCPGLALTTRWQGFLV
jgi:hypothetical protein